MKDNEELMNTIRQYLKQKVAKGFSGKRVDMDVMKKELRDEITHILYDQTRRTPIVIPVINEVGGRPNGQSKDRGSAGNSDKTGVPRMPTTRKFPQRQEPDSETQVPQDRSDVRGY